MYGGIRRRACVCLPVVVMLRSTNFPFRTHCKNRKSLISLPVVLQIFSVQPSFSLPSHCPVFRRCTVLLPLACLKLAISFHNSPLPKKFPAPFLPHNSLPPTNHRKVPH